MRGGIPPISWTSELQNPDDTDQWYQRDGERAAEVKIVRTSTHTYCEGHVLPGSKINRKQITTMDSHFENFGPDRMKLIPPRIQNSKSTDNRKWEKFFASPLTNRPIEHACGESKWSVRKYAQSTIRGHRIDIHRHCHARSAEGFDGATIQGHRGPDDNRALSFLENICHSVTLPFPNNMRIIICSSRHFEIKQKPVDRLFPSICKAITNYRPRPQVQCLRLWRAGKWPLQSRSSVSHETEIRSTGDFTSDVILRYW